MSKTDRTTLKNRYKTGMRPTQQDFEDLIDSSVSGLEDGISVDPVTKNVGLGVTAPKEKLQLNGAITIGNTTNATPDAGTVKYDNGSSKFMGFNGAWIDLGAPGGGDTFWKQPVANTINYAVGSDEVDVTITASNPALTLKAQHPVTHAISQFSISADGLVNQLTYKGQAHLFNGNNNKTYLNVSPGDDVVQISTSAGALVTCVGDTVNISKLVVGDLTATTHWTPPPSDIRVKKNIRPYTEGLTAISALTPVSFEYNGLAATVDGQPHIGLIAQELQQAVPEMVETFERKLRQEDEKETPLLYPKSQELVYLAINAIKELQQRIVQLERKVGYLETQLSVTEHQ